MVKSQLNLLDDIVINAETKKELESILHKDNTSLLEKTA